MARLRHFNECRVVSEMPEPGVYSVGQVPKGRSTELMIRSKSPPTQVRIKAMLRMARAQVPLHGGIGSPSMRKRGSFELLGRNEASYELLAQTDRKHVLP